MTYVDKTSYFEVASPGHTIAYKNVDNLLQLVGIYSNLLCNLKYAWCLRNVQILRGFDFIELIYKLFDNPSYDYVLTRYSGNTRHSFPYVSGNVSS